MKLTKYYKKCINKTQPLVCKYSIKNTYTYKNIKIFETNFI